MSARARIAAALCAALAASCGGIAPEAERAAAPAPSKDEASSSASPLESERGRDVSEVPRETAEERDAARQLFDSVNEERAAGGLPRLAWAADLAAVGRGYCAEMARTGAIAHVSPESGGPADRAERAGIPFVRLTENLALAPDAAAAHEGLMNSPGHRANILDDGVSEVGIGAMFTIKDGARSLVVTQLFAAPPEHIDPDAADDDVASRLNDARKAAGLAPLARHKWLDAQAKGALRSCKASAIADSAKAEKAPPFRLLTVVMLRGGTIPQIAGGLAENEHALSAELTHFGVAAAQVDGSGSGLCVVVMFGVKR
jgi:uncharacterized protein YkwD